MNFWHFNNSNPFLLWKFCGDECAIVTQSMPKVEKGVWTKDIETY